MAIHIGRRKLMVALWRSEQHGQSRRGRIRDWVSRCGFPDTFAIPNGFSHGSAKAGRRNTEVRYDTRRESST
jgi:hypothetical protein